MEKIYHSLTELIGRTPLLEISHIEKKEQLKARVLVKLESFNPGGSVKDRAAFYMIEAAEKEGLLHPGSLIIEPTSGNTGIGLAWIASVKGYRLTLTMPETTSLERRNLLKALGATLVLTPGSEGMKGAIRRAEELKAAHPGAFIPGQFDNPANPEAHVQTTAEEIWKYMNKSKNEKVESVMLTTYPEVNSQYENEELRAKWEKIVKIKEIVSKKLEEARAEKIIGHSLNAKVTLFAEGDLYKFIKENKELLQTVFIISNLEVEENQRSNEEKLGVKIEQAEGEKCERCWMYSTTVGEDKENPTICHRCSEALK